MHYELLATFLHLSLSFPPMATAIRQEFSSIFHRFSLNWFRCFLFFFFGLHARFSQPLDKREIEIKLSKGLCRPKIYDRARAKRGTDTGAFRPSIFRFRPGSPLPRAIFRFSPWSPLEAACPAPSFGRKHPLSEMTLWLVLHNPDRQSEQKEKRKDYCKDGGSGGMG